MRSRRGWKGQRKRGADITGTGPMWTSLAQHLDGMRARNYSPETVRQRDVDVRRFLAWCDERSISEPTDVTQPVIERYQRWLYYYRRSNGNPLTFGTQYHLLSAVKLFFRWMTREHLTLFNPAAEIELPRLPYTLPRDILTAAEVEAVMSQPDIHDSLGIRDRAILETFYATGIRRSELANLALYDLDAARGTLMVRLGKGQRDRVVPIGQRARAWIDRYVTDVRPLFVVEPDARVLFLTIDGTRFEGRHVLGDLVKKYIRAANVGKNGACHIFRHTVATLMLENGADVRYVQELLGHRKLSTTAIYTHVSIGKLQQIYQATHPAEIPPDAANPRPAALTAEQLAALADDDPEDADGGVT